MRGVQDSSLPAYTMSRNIYCESATTRNEPRLMWPVFRLEVYIVCEQSNVSWDKYVG
jgi:hypothetical protein